MQAPPCLKIASGWQCGAAALHAPCMCLRSHECQKSARSTSLHYHCSLTLDDRARPHDCKLGNGHIAQTQDQNGNSTAAVCLPASRSSKKVMAWPLRPALPVRPTLHPVPLALTGIQILRGTPHNPISHHEQGEQMPHAAPTN